MKKDFYQSAFKNKNITVMGLGILGRGVKVADFLADCGGKLTITDLKSKKELKKSLWQLRKHTIKYRLGKHSFKDFVKADMIIKGPSVPLDSPYIKRAKLMDIDIAMDASLFARIVKNIEPKVTIIGVTGTRGKSMTTAMIYHILKNNEKKLGSRVHLGGNMRMKATLPLLKEVEAGDIVILELDSWQSQGFGDERISPHIAVFTSFMPDHMDYYKNDIRQYLSDKSNIFKFQKEGDVLITSKVLKKILPISKYHKGRLIVAKPLSRIRLPNVIGHHNMQNASYAYSAARTLGLSEPMIKRAMKSFPGLEGRLQYLGLRRGVRIFNDNSATTPEATIVAIDTLRSLYKKRNIILMAGGSDKGLDLKGLARSMKNYCKEVILMPGSGSNRLIDNIKKQDFQHLYKANILSQSIKKSFELSRKGDIILFSPGFASKASFKNSYDRNDQFMKIMRTKYK